MNEEIEYEVLTVDEIAKLMAIDGYDFDIESDFFEWAEKVNLMIDIRGFTDNFWEAVGDEVQEGLASEAWEVIKDE